MKAYIRKSDGAVYARGDKPANLPEDAMEVDVEIVPSFAPTVVEIDAPKKQAATDEIYRSLPIEAQAAFAPLYVAVKDFLARGEFEVAAAIVANQAVPPELEQVKAALVAEISAK